MSLPELPPVRGKLLRDARLRAATVGDPTQDVLFGPMIHERFAERARMYSSLDDMLADGPPLLIDRFSWDPTAGDDKKQSKRPPPP